MKSSLKINRVGIILARGGSKGILNKNIKKLGGKPLVSWSIEFALKEKYFDEIIVSTDSNKIKKVAKKFKDLKIHNRSKKNSNDMATSESAIREVVKNYKLENSLLVLIEPTSPFRKKGLLKKMEQKLLKTKTDCCLCLKNFEKNPTNIFSKDKNSILCRIYNTNKTYFRRQEFTHIKTISEGLYMFFPYILSKFKKITDSKLTGINCNNTINVNIDNMMDLHFANYIIRKIKIVK